MPPGRAAQAPFRGRVCNERTGGTGRPLALAGGRRLPEVHTAEEGLEARVGAEGVQRCPDVEPGQQSVAFVGCSVEPRNGLIAISESWASGGTPHLDAPQARHESARTVAVFETEWPRLRRAAEAVIDNAAPTFAPRGRQLPDRGWL